MASAASSGQAPAAHEVFVRAIDLPTLSLRQARAAVAQQIDILSPLPAGETAWSLVLLGPSEGGLNCFAVGIVPSRTLAELAPDGAAVRLTGCLDGRDIEFRFDGVGAPRPPVDRLRIATLAGACLAIVLTGANLRVDRELDLLQAHMDAAAIAERQRTAEAANAARVLTAWRAAAASHRASVVDCALGDLAKVGGAAAKVAKLEFADGQVTAIMSAPVSDAAVAGFRALGATASPSATATPMATASPAPVATPVAAPASAAAPSVQQFQIGPAACG